MAAVDLLLVDGSTVTVDNSQVTYVQGVDSAVEVIIPTMGENPIVLTVNDTVSDVVTLLARIVSIDTSYGSKYVNADKIMTIFEVTGGTSKVTYNSDFGAFNDIFASTESRSSIKTKIAAL
tara:strand:- start:35341 stop:35703 length:363 start_codon:yes stop_codon:yes gene_type:complete